MRFLDFFRSKFSGPSNDSPGMPSSGSARVGLLRIADEQRRVARSGVASGSYGPSSQSIISSAKGASVSMKDGKLVVKLSPGGKVSGSITKNGEVLDYEISS